MMNSHRLECRPADLDLLHTVYHWESNPDMGVGMGEQPRVGDEEAPLAGVAGEIRTPKATRSERARCAYFQ
jgi:hypothetical protein